MNTVNTLDASQIVFARQAEVQSGSLLERVQDSQAEQTALLETSPSESQYSAALAVQIEAKCDQVERIENRLEVMISEQTIRLEQTESNQPGRFSRPSTRNNWQQQMQRQQATKQRLEERLEAVREIRDAMGVHGPRIEELATRKLRSQEPELAADYDEIRTAQRGHEALLRRQEQERKKRLAQAAGEGQGRSLSMGLTPIR